MRGSSYSTSTLVIATTAAVGAVLALLLVGPPTTRRKKITRKIKPAPLTPQQGPASTNSPSGSTASLSPIPPPQLLSASWSFVDQSTTQLHSFAALFRARDHAEKLYSVLAEPETYYPATRQSEFGVEVLERTSGFVRFIRYKRSRTSRGARVVVDRRTGEEENAASDKKNVTGSSAAEESMDSDSTPSWFIVDTLTVFNTTITVRHTVQVVEEEPAPPAAEVTEASSGAVVVPNADSPIEHSIVLQVEVTANGPLGTAWVLERKYAERMEAALTALEHTWNGKDVSGGLGRI
ncbi:uncharacterized protein EV422DRAFT_506702 [Fimicolochytrium jonesii]|uniref:uncharacterized protein n=1 Tax=Fimicolochytrium jonesii TaxID=1396493 RepID=UPI0022FF2798|nr:uncharacterized protein EV422DRAFT_506702 [Fimicolochytrium jonesii]KAI8820461.1 hypothetical protein EV422DRAFT_506702 [Fimicolochytrium jonesii]